MAPSPRLQRWTYRIWAAVGLLVLAYAALRVLGRPLAVLVPPLLLAMLIVYLLNPAVEALHRRGVPRWAGTGLAYLGLLTVLAVGVALLVPALSAQLQAFASLLPQLGTRLTATAADLLARVGLELPATVTATPEEVGEELQRFLASQENRSALVAVLGGLSGLAASVVHLLVVVVLGPVIAFYLLVDLPRVQRLVTAVTPPEHRAEVAELGAKLGRVVGGFVRGQLLVALFVGVSTAIGLAVVGLPFWLVIGVAAGVSNLVPLIGPFVAGVLGVTVALAVEGVGQALLVVAVLTAIQQVDNHLVSPLVVGRSVRVHPLLVLLALLVAGTLYGVFGMLVAVPAVAAANVLGLHLWQTRVPWAAEDGAAMVGQPAPSAVPADR